MDFVRAVKFPLDDEDWITKVVVGTLLSLFFPFSLGYTVSVARNVMHSKSRPLPGTGDLGQVITDGIMASIAALVYMFPALLAGCVVSIFGAIVGDSDAGGLMVLCLGLGVSMVSLIYAIPAAAMFWVGVMHYAESGNFSEFIRFGALWREVRQHGGILGILALHVLGLVLVASLLSPLFLVTCIGIPVLGFWVQLAQGHLIGQTALEIEQAG